MYSPHDRYAFPATHVGTSSTLKVNIRNNSADMHEVRPAVCPAHVVVEARHRPSVVAADRM